jgi:hypothetical protein
LELAPLKVILLEKSDKIGGEGMFAAMGLLAYKSKHQKAAGERATVRARRNCALRYEWTQARRED